MGDAQAHAVLLESVPPQGAALEESPPTVTLRFNAKLEHSVTSVTLTDTQKTLIPVELATHTRIDQVVLKVPPLPPGVYLLAYKVLARDGHLTEGTLHFTVLTR